jgi:hypothetical protein
MKAQRLPRIVLLAAILGVVTIGVTRAEDPPAESFSITYPDNWEPLKQLPNTAVKSAALAPLDAPEDDFRENINIVVEQLPRDFTSEQYYAEAVKAMARMLTDYKPVEHKTVQLGGVDAVRAIYEHRSGNYKLRVLVYMLTREKTAHVVTCTAETDAYAQYEKPFEDICATFKLN